MIARARMSIIAALLAGCSSGGYVVELELDPASLAGSVDRIELAVVRSCPAVAQRADDPAGVLGEVRRLARTDARRRLDLAVAPGRIGLHARAWQGCDLVAVGCEDHDVVAGGSGTLGVTLLERPRSADCPGAEACCGAECVSLADDERHCGACGAACAGGETCSASACGAPGDAGAPPDGGARMPESCDGIDNDCDGRVDEDLSRTLFRDADGDGWGEAAATMEGCDGTAGWAAMPGDCDDGDAGRSPAAGETCNAVDDDCDGAADDGFECVLGSTDACLECGYTGTRTCVGCSWASCAFSVDVRVEGNDTRLTHVCGSASDTDWISCGSSNCWVQAGPNLMLPAGRYRVDYQIGTSVPETFDLQVRDSLRGGILAARPNVAHTGIFPESLEFVSPLGCDILFSFELLVRGTECVRVYDTRVVRTGD